MGHKTHPIGFRVGISRNWLSRWFNDKDYAKFALEDYKIREFLKEKLSSAGLESIEIERSRGKVKVIVYVSRPGLVIGRGGSGAELIKEDLKPLVSAALDFEVKESDRSKVFAALVADKVARQIERRRHPKKVANFAADEVMARGAKGVRIIVSGRILGAEIARREKITRGLIPLQKLRADVDFAKDTAHTKYGSIGVKVWVYRGEKEI